MSRPMFIHTMQIFKKEFCSYFQSRMAMLVFAIYAAITAGITFFRSQFLTNADPAMLTFFRLQADILVLIIPAMTIKLWADEKRQGTFELTASLPVSSMALVLGKFLAVWSLCGLMLVSTAGLWVSSAVLTNIDNWAVLQNYVVCLLLCGTLCALSMCATVFTANPISAFAVALAVCLGFSLIDFSWMVSSLGFSSEVLLRIAESLNLGGNFSSLIAGQLSIGGICYFVSLAFFALWLNVFALERRFVSKSGAALLGINLIVSFVALNIAVSLLGGQFIYDSSRDKRFTLSAETQNWLNRNSNDLFIRLYFSENLKDKNYLDDVVRLLEQYQQKSHNRLSLHTVKVSPLSREEVEAQKAGITRQPDETMLGLAISDSQGNFATIPHLQSGRRAYLEHDISRVLSRLSGYSPPVISIISSLPSINGGTFGDSNIDQPFAAILGQAYKLNHLLAGIGTIPAGTDLLLVINPRNLSAAAVYAIDQYLMRGGRLMIFMDPLSEEQLLKQGKGNGHSNLEDFLQNLGIAYSDNVVAGDNLHNRPLEVEGKAESYPFWINAVAEENSHPLVRGLKPFAFNTAGYFEPMPTEGHKTDILLATSADSGESYTSWLEYGSFAKTMENYTPLNKPLPLIVLQEGKFSSFYDHPLIQESKIPFLSVSIKDGKVLLVSDSDFLDAKLWNNNLAAASVYDFVPASGNMDFVERAADYLTGNDKILNIAPKKESIRGISVMDILAYHAHFKYAAEIAAVEETLEKTGRELTELNKLQELKGQAPSWQTSRNIDNLELKHSEMQQQLRGLRAAEINCVKLLLGLYTLGNFILQMLVFALWMLVFALRRRRLLRQVERIANA